MMTKLRTTEKTCRLGQSATTYHLNYVVVVVDDLNRAVNDYRSLGFTVTSSQEVEGGLERACVFFGDTNRTYIELLSLSRSWAKLTLKVLRSFGFDLAWTQRDVVARRTLARAAQRGAGNLALTHGFIEVGLEDAGFRGLERHNPRPERAAFLPLSTDDAATRHANGATGVATVTVAVKNLDRSVADYRALLGLEPFHQLASPLLSVRTASFSFAGATLKLAQPTGAGAVKDFLKTHGEGPCALTLRTTASAIQLDGKRTHGINLKL